MQCPGEDDRNRRAGRASELRTSLALSSGPQRFTYGTIPLRHPPSVGELPEHNRIHFPTKSLASAMRMRNGIVYEGSDGTIVLYAFVGDQRFRGSMSLK